MYEQAEPVRSPFSRTDSGQTSGPPSQPPPVHQGGSRGRVRHGNGASDKWQGDQEKSTDTYEEAEAVKRYATYTSTARTYPDGASGRRVRCSFIHSHRSYLAAGIAVLLSLVAVGFAPLTVMNKEEISQLSATVEALKRDQDDMRQLSATVEALKLKRDQDDMRQLSATVDALKRDRDYMSTTVEALKRNQDDMRQLSATVDALKCNQDDMSTTVDALKRDRDYMSTTVEALKRNQDMSTTIDALKRSQDMSTTVDALKRNQDDMSTTVDALMRDQDDMSTTVDALKLGLDNERIAALEQRFHEMSKTSDTSCPKGYTVFRGICYKAFNTTKTFSDAAAACGKDGGTLAMPRDAETDAFLISLYKSVSDRGKFWWFGLHDQREEGSFEWVDGSALGTYSPWASEQPDNYGGSEDCVHYSSYWTTKEKWNDASCTSVFYFICQAVPGRPKATGGTLTTTVQRLSDHPQ